VGAVLEEELIRLLAADPGERYDARLARYRTLGLPTPP
jgi:hypothetical protein